MENKAHALIAGSFVLLVGALLVALAFWLGRDGGERRPYELATRQAVTGLQAQAPVRFRGVDVGKVRQISLDPSVPGQVLVRIDVDPAVPVSAGSFATLGYQGVTGLAFVDLDDNGQNPAALAMGPNGVARIELRQGLIGQLSDQGMAILSQTRETTRRLNELLDPKNQQQVMATIERIGAAADGVQRLSARLDATLTQQVNPALARVPALAEEGQQTVRALRQAADAATASANEISRATQRLNASGGLIDQMAATAEAVEATAESFNATTVPRINQASDSAARSARQFERTMGDISTNPQTLIYGSGNAPPGPGEPGFSAPTAAPGARP